MSLPDESPSTSSLLVRDPENSLTTSVLVVGIGAFVSFVLGSLIIHPAFGTMLALLVLGAGLMFGAPTLQAALKWHPPQLEFGQAQFDLGSVPTVSYRRRSRRPIDVSSAEVAFELRCAEHVTYTQGTDTRTDQRTLYKETGTGGVSGTPTGVEGEFTFNVSANAGGPSLDLMKNKVKWELEVWLTGARLPKDRHTFAINVVPSLDPALRVIQDT